MMGSWEEIFEEIVPELKNYIITIMSAEKVLLGKANPPKEPGAYIIYDHNGSLSYIGEAKGSGGLRDRLLSKHISGSDTHAIQRAYMSSHPNRDSRRDFIKQNVKAQWVATSSANHAMAVERLLVLMLNPPWNRK